MRLENKVAVVTGASSGMGKAITTRFVQEGAKVVAVARRIERLEELAESLKGEPGEIEIFSADITSVDKNNEMIDFAVDLEFRLADLQKELDEVGFVEEYCNGQNQFGTKESTASKAYSTTLKNYNSLIRTLLSCMPQKSSDDVDDGFEAFVGTLKK